MAEGVGTDRMSVFRVSSGLLAFTPPPSWSASATSALPSSRPDHRHDPALSDSRIGPQWTEATRLVS